MPEKRVMLITGAAGGIGRATVKLFSEKGWNVIGVDRSPYGKDFPESGLFIQSDVSLEKNINMKFDGQSILDNYVNVVMQNEEEDKKKIAKFLSKVQEKINKVKSRRVVEGYINLIKEINLMKVEI